MKFKVPIGLHMKDDTVALGIRFKGLFDHAHPRKMRRSAKPVMR